MVGIASEWLMSGHWHKAAVQRLVIYFGFTLNERNR